MSFAEAVKKHQEEAMKNEPNGHLADNDGKSPATSILEEECKAADKAKNDKERLEASVGGLKDCVQNVVAQPVEDDKIVSAVLKNYLLPDIGSDGSGGVGVREMVRRMGELTDIATDKCNQAVEDLNNLIKGKPMQNLITKAADKDEALTRVIKQRQAELEKLRVAVEGRWDEIEAKKNKVEKKVRELEKKKETLERDLAETRGRLDDATNELEGVTREQDLVIADYLTECNHKEAAIATRKEDKERVYRFIKELQDDHEELVGKYKRDYETVETAHEEAIKAFKNVFKAVETKLNTYDGMVEEYVVVAEEKMNTVGPSGRKLLVSALAEKLHADVKVCGETKNRLIYLHGKCKELNETISQSRPEKLLQPKCPEYVF